MVHGAHTIRLPGVILDELKNVDYSDDRRFQNIRKHAVQALSRKDKRKQQRLQKKKRKPVENPQRQERPPQAVSKSAQEELPFSSDDELSPGDFEEFGEDDLNEDEWEQLKELESDEDMDAAATMKALEAAKSKKQDKEFYPLPPTERLALEKDEMEMQYYAKKLGLKGDKKIHAKDEYDAIGGLLEGLDYFENYGKDDEEYGELEYVDGDKPKEFSSDDDLSSGDFDEFDEDDLNEEEWQQLHELEEDEQSNDEEQAVSSKRENPYVAPTSEGSYVPPSLRKSQADSAQNATVEEISKKVRALLNKVSDSNTTTMISSLNELYDSYSRRYVTEVIATQLIRIINQSNKLLDSFIMNYSAIGYALWKLRGIEVGALIVQKTVEVFLEQYESAIKLSSEAESTAITPKHCSNTITLLAYFYNFGLISSRLIFDLIHLFVETPNEFNAELLLKVVSVSGQLIRGDDPSALKDILTVLLSNVKTISNPSTRLKFLLETMSDLKNNRLKPSILAVSHQNVKKLLAGSVKGNSYSESLQVSLADIKSVETKGQWWLVGASWRGNTEHAFQEAEEDLKIGATKMLQKKTTVNDQLLEEIPDWVAISKRQRMNTDVRRAIFISIMSAQDYIDAFTKLEKLNLENKQVLEIPHVLIRCLVTDAGSNGYNPFYSLIGAKLCEQHHHLAKAFRFQFWDIIKKFEQDVGSDEELSDAEDDISEDVRLKQNLAKARFFGYFLSEGILKLDIFKHVSLMGGLTSDGNLFIEMMLSQFLLSFGKRCEYKEKDPKTNKQITTYNDSYLSKLCHNGVKLENQKVIWRGLQWFMQKRYKNGSYLLTNKNSKQYKRDSRRLEWAVSAFNKILKDGLESLYE